MTEIRLYGSLADKFGPRRTYAVRSVREAVRALRTNIPEFEETISDMELAVFWTNTEDPDDPARLEIDKDLVSLRLPPGKVLHIMPAISGANAQKNAKRNATVKTVIGVTLIIASIATGNPFLAKAGADTMLTTTGMFFLAGVSLTFNGVAGMIAPTPGAENPNEKEDERASFLFNSMVNVSAQGHAVPVVYGGPIRVGSVVVSAGFDTISVMVPSGGVYDPINNPGGNLPGDYYTWTPRSGGGNYQLP